MPSPCCFSKAVARNRATLNIINLPGRVEYQVRVLSLAVAVVELMRWIVPDPFRTDVGLVLERSVERGVYGGQVETAHRRTSDTVAAEYEQIFFK